MVTGNNDGGTAAGYTWRMRRMLSDKSSSPSKVMSKERSPKVKNKSVSKTPPKENRFQQKLYALGKLSKRVNWNPVVILNRLPKNYESWKISSPKTSPKLSGKSRLKKRNGLIAKGPGGGNWKETVVVAGCSLDGKAAPATQEDGPAGPLVDEKKDDPEVDVIDGVKFLSFLHEPDTREFSCFHSSYHPFFSDCASENSRETSLSDDYKQLIIPTKTRDITQIKGWRKKIFGDCDEYAMPPSDERPQPDNGDVPEENRSFKDLYDSDHDPDDFHPVMGTLDEVGDTVFDDEEASNHAESRTGKVDPQTLQVHKQLSRAELKAPNASAAFQSQGLEEFLGQKSELNIGLLSQYDPNVKILEKDSPILAVGTLKKDDYVPPWKKLMERQRKRKELLESQRRSKNEGQADRVEREKTPPPPVIVADSIETELGNKIVWLDEDSDSEEEEPPTLTSNDTTPDMDAPESVLANLLLIDQLDHSSVMNHSILSKVESSEEDTSHHEEPESSVHDGDNMWLEATTVIKSEPVFEETSIETNWDNTSQLTPVQSDPPVRTKRTKKLSWKLLSSYEQNGRTKKSPSPVEEPIKISLKHSPDRTSWVINNVVSENEKEATRKGKRKRKIRNYSFIYANEENAWDYLPEFEIVSQTVWSKNRVMEMELCQYLADLRSPFVYEESLRLYERTTNSEMDNCPDLNEGQAAAACATLATSKDRPKHLTSQAEKWRESLERRNAATAVKRKKPSSKFTQIQNSLSFDRPNSQVNKASKDSWRTNKRPSTTTLKDVDDPEFIPSPASTKRKKMAKEPSRPIPVRPEAPKVPKRNPGASKRRRKELASESDSGDNNESSAVPSFELNTTTPNDPPGVTHLGGSSRPETMASTPVTDIAIQIGGSPVSVGGSGDEIVELPTPEASKSDEEVVAVTKKRLSKESKKRQKQKRELQKTLILKSFRQVVSGNTVLKSFIVANQNISSKAKENMSLGLCAVGLAMNRGSEGKNDIFLLYGKINDPVYNEAVQRSFYEEQNGIETHHYVVPIVLEISKAAMKSSNDLKLVKIPLKGRALIDTQAESVPMMMYPVATKPPDEDIAAYSNKSGVVEVPSAIPKDSAKTSNGDIQVVREVRRSSPEKVTLNSSGEESQVEVIKRKKNAKITTSVVRVRNGEELEDEVDILNRSDDDGALEGAPTEAATRKKAKFYPQNRTQPIKRFCDVVVNPSEGSLTVQPFSFIGEAINAATLLGKGSSLPPLRPKMGSVSQQGILLPRKISVDTQLPTPLFAGTFGASKRLANLKSLVDSQPKSGNTAKISKPSSDIPCASEDDVSLVKEILAADKSGTGTSTKELKLLSTSQLNLIKGIVEPVQPELHDPVRDQELRSAAEAAWQLVGPCIVRRVKLRNGNVVYVYKSCPGTQQLTSVSPQNFPLRHSSPVITVSNTGVGQEIRHQVLDSQTETPDLVNNLASKKPSVTYSRTANPKVPTTNHGTKSVYLLSSENSPPHLSPIAQSPIKLDKASNNGLSSLKPQTKLDFGSIESTVSQTPKIIHVVSPMTIETITPPSPPKKDVLVKPIETDLLSNETSVCDSNPNTSVWMGIDGEPCYVMRLDDQEMAEEDITKVPTITGCFPISEEEFQRCETVSCTQAVT